MGEHNVSRMAVVSLSGVVSYDKHHIFLATNLTNN